MARCQRLTVVPNGTCGMVCGIAGKCPALGDVGTKKDGYGIRGMDVDRSGVVSVPVDSGHIASFDRRKCKEPLNGPGAELGEKCPEGWRFYSLPGPSQQGDSGVAENPYYEEVIE